MSNINHYSTLTEKRKKRVRKKLHGTEMRPRLNVFRSNRHISLQVINDDAGKTLVGVSDKSKTLKLTGNKTEKSIGLAKELAKLLTKKKIEALVFDRGSYRYHGRVKAVAEALREAGIKI